MNRKLFKTLALSLLALSWTACGDDIKASDPGVSSTEFKVSKTEMTFAKTGGTAQLYVQAQGEATVSSDASWCSVAKEASSSQTVQKFNVTATANTDNNDRTATLSISAANGTATVRVVENATEGLVIRSDKAVSIDAAGGTFNISLSTNSAVTVSTSNEWISQTNTRANMHDESYSFSVAANVAAARTGSVSFSIEADNSSITESVTVSQEASASIGEITKNALQIASEMYPGWNLGNTMEATGSGLGAETYWQGTKTTQAIIDYVKAQGFRSVRIPCSWEIHSTDGVIDAAWMNRVREVVDYCLSAGLYVLLNDHYDGGWIEVLGFSESMESYQPVSEATVTAKAARLKEIWTQIATAFKDYGENLLFAGLNEPFQEYNLFSSRHAEMTPILLTYNQAFVDAVRATGGNNAKRTLVVQAPSANITSACADVFTLPADNAEKALMLEAHFYDPWGFCGDSGSGAFFYWGSENHVSGSSHNSSYGEGDWPKQQMQSLKAKFFDNGVPVILGEYGAQWREVSEDQAKHDASVKLWFKEVTQQAISNGVVPMVWDINNTNRGGEQGTMTVIDRKNLSIFCAPALEGITAGVAAAQWPQ